MSSFRDIINEDGKALVTGDFAEEITVSDGVAEPVLVRGIHNESYETVDPDTNMVVSSTKPAVTVWAADVPFRVKVGHLVTTRGKTYRVRDPQRDGEGSLVLLLD